MSERYYDLLKIDQRTKEALEHAKGYLDLLVKGNNREKACDVYKECLSTDLEFVPFYRMEALRCVRYSYESTLVHFQIENLQSLLDQPGLGNMQKLRKELAGLFRETFRGTDILTDQDHSGSLLILTHTDVKNATIVMERLKARVESVFTKELKIAYRTTKICAEDPDLMEVLGGCRH